MSEESRPDASGQETGGARDVDRAHRVRKCRSYMEDMISGRGESLENASRLLQEHLGAFMPMSNETLGEIEEAYQELRAQLNIEILGVPTVSRRHQPWYAGPGERDVIWPSLRQHLGEQKGWSDEAIGIIDRSSSKVVSRLHNPGAPGFSTRGLVVGYVQSGKTANMTAVMAKAADRSFRFFIVLSGMTDALRNQTQARLEEDLVNQRHEKWHSWTTVDSDFRGFTGKGFPPLASDKRYLAVVKKNAAVLRRLLTKIRQTNRAVFKKCPVMVIDDECDQASVNTSRYRDQMTAINRHVREILQELPRVAYVGYTATPFANVLIDPAISIDRDRPDDLYPRDFILSLPRPDAYFGPERIFGRDVLEADEAGDFSGLDMIRNVPADEISSLRPANRPARLSFQLSITESLNEAIRYYLLATAARLSRGDAGRHSSMLVHTTSYVEPHFKAMAAIQDHVGHLAFRLRSGDPGLLRELQEQWALESSRVSSAELGLAHVCFGELQVHLLEVVETVQVVVENGESIERLDFSLDPEGNGRRYIVVGGNVLARGLTIEGLVVSFFLRTSSQYDTLMQMGRWFGYRQGYEDLPRVWMTEDLWQSFHDLATVEQEIRNEIVVYERNGLTPLEFAVRIRQIPGMAITARNKMLGAERCSISYSNSHEQTFRFLHRNREWLTRNWDAGSRLIDAAITHGGVKAGRSGRVLPDVPVSLIIDFLESYQVHPSHEHLKVDRIREYIAKENSGESTPLGTWTVIVVEVQGGGETQRDLGTLGRVRTVKRSRMGPGSGNSDEANIKALMSRSDLLIDMPPGLGDAKQSWDELKELRRSCGLRGPVLLLYPVEAESAPRVTKKTSDQSRIKLDAAMDVLGMGLLFPSSDRATAVSYVRVPLPDVEYEETEMPEDETSPEEEGA